MMFCRKCGFQNEDDANFCLKCGARLAADQTVYAGGQQPEAPSQQTNTQPQQQYGQPWPPYAQQPNTINDGYPYSQNTENPYAYGPYNSGYILPVNSHLVLSIVSIFFNLILGIIAIVYSSKSKNCYNMGDYNGAVSNAHTAKTLAIIGIIVGGVFTLFYTIMGIAALLYR